VRIGVPLCVAAIVALASLSLAKAQAPPREVWIVAWPSMVTHLAGPDAPYSDCCAYMNDLDNGGVGDGDVDLKDFALFQNGYACPAEGLCGYQYFPAGGKGNP